MSNISLDYDHTFTADPFLWTQFVSSARLRGHKVYLITMRYENDPAEAGEIHRIAHLFDGVVFTNRLAKRKVAVSKAIYIDIWIDDSPVWIGEDALG